MSKKARSLLGWIKNSTKKIRTFRGWVSATAGESLPFPTSYLVSIDNNYTVETNINHNLISVITNIENPS